MNHLHIKNKITKLLSVFIGLTAITLVLSYLFASSIESESIKAFKSSDRTEQVNDIVVSKKPMSILLIGNDASKKRSAEEGARSDTMILLVMKPEKKQSRMFSISRDIYAQVDDTSYDKINAAYSLNQEQGAVEAVERLLNTHVDGYVSVNMDALTDIVDAVGGITVNNKLGEPISIVDTEPDYKATVKPGKQHINGEQALVYARMRYQDPEGDTGRQKRQQEVISALIKKLAPTALTNYKKLIKAIGNNVVTDIPNDQYASIIASYSDALMNASSESVIGQGEMIQNIYYQIVGRNNLLAIQNRIRELRDEEPVSELQFDETQMLIYDDSNLEQLDTSVHYDLN